MADLISEFVVSDVRFPTSRLLDGSDAMNPDPDYSAAYLELRTSAADAGYGFVFTIGRGNDLQTSAIKALQGHLVGRDTESVLKDLGGLWRELTFDSQLRWLGPDKGIEHMAVGAVVDALWDLRARRAGKPLWKLLVDLPPTEIVDLVDFTYLADALTPDEALRLLESRRDGIAERERRLRMAGLPAYTTSAGWLGYNDEKVRQLCLAAMEAGFDHIKLKVGANLDDDIRRCELVRATVGPGVRISVDANQRWGVSEAVQHVRKLAHVDLWWVEEPTHPDDVLGHRAIRSQIAPIRVATGEHVANQVLFKQYLAADAIDVCQLDATRVGGVNENLAIILLAAKYGVPVCPHAGGVGLCELVQHLAMFDHIAVSGTTEHRWLEYVDHLHEHFETPVVLEHARYTPPEAPGSGARMHAESVAAFRYPDGRAWA
jgi:L-fuconate dehydratase